MILALQTLLSSSNFIDPTTMQGYKYRVPRWAPVDRFRLVVCAVISEWFQIFEPEKKLLAKVSIGLRR